MATLEELSNALRKADAAGNAEDARAIANAIRSMQASIPPNGGMPSSQAPAAPTMPPQSAAPAGPQSFGTSLPGQAVAGFNEGLADILGFPVQMANDFVIRPAMAGINAVTGSDLQASDRPVMGQQWMRDAMAPTIAPETQDPSGRMIRRVGQEFGSAAIPAAGIASRAARPLQMLATEAGLTMGSGTGAAIADQVAPDNPLAEIGGQIAGGMGVAGITGAARRAITPFPTSPERIQAADALAREGVDLTAGQRTGNQGLRYAESELGGGAAGDLMGRQAEQFTSAALRRAGISADRATPEVIDGAFNRIGGEFNSLGARNALPLDQQLGSDLGDALREYMELVPASNQAPVVQNFLQDLVQMAGNTNVIPGRDYQAFRSRFDRLARSAKSDPQLSQALYGIRNALDDATERWMQQNNPDDIQRWRDARREYRNMLVLERAATGAGENAAMGLISPAALRQAASTLQGRRNYARGDGDFAELARAGTATMSPLPNSGTASRLTARNLGTALPSVIGAAAGSPGGILGSMAGAAAGAAVPALAGRAMLSRPGRAYLANQLMAGPPQAGPRGVGPLAAMLSNSEEQPALPDRRRELLIRQLMGAP